MIKYIRLWEQPKDIREKLCWEFFSGPYTVSFPNANQTESPDIWLPLMIIPPSIKPRVHIIVVLENNVVIGGIVFEEYSSGDWLSTYLAIDPKQRKTGFGKMLVTEMKSAIEEKSVPGGFIFGEVEHPLKVPENYKKNAMDRLKFMENIGMHAMPFTYIQPALGEGKAAEDDLMLVTTATQPILTTRLESFLKAFYASLDQSDSILLTRMVSEVSIPDKLLPVPLRSFVPEAFS